MGKPIDILALMLPPFEIIEDVNKTIISGPDCFAEKTLRRGRQRRQGSGPDLLFQADILVPDVSPDPSDKPLSIHRSFHFSRFHSIKDI